MGDGLAVGGGVCVGGVGLGVGVGAGEPVKLKSSRYTTVLSTPSVSTTTTLTFAERAASGAL
jgi:hypothetical protein